MCEPTARITVSNHAKAVKLLAKLWLLRERSQFIDVTLMSNDGYSCPVHACVVAAQSEFLQQVLAQHMSKAPNRLVTDRATTTRDSKENVVDTQDPIYILLEELSPFMLRTCIEYMYGKEVTLSYTSLNDVIRAADYLKIEQLESQCHEILQALVGEATGDSISLSTPKNETNDENITETMSEEGETVKDESETTSQNESETTSQQKWIVKHENETEVKLESVTDKPEKDPSVSAAKLTSETMKLDIVTDKLDKKDPSVSVGKQTPKTMKLDSLTDKPGKKDPSVSVAKQTPKTTRRRGQSPAQKEIWLYYDSENGQLKTAFQSSGSEVAEIDSSVLPLLGDAFKQQAKKESETPAKSKKTKLLAAQSAQKGRANNGKKSPQPKKLPQPKQDSPAKQENTQQNSDTEDEAMATDGQISENNEKEDISQETDAPKTENDENKDIFKEPNQQISENEENKDEVTDTTTSAVKKARKRTRTPKGENASKRTPTSKGEKKIRTPKGEKAPKKPRIQKGDKPKRLQARPNAVKKHTPGEPKPNRKGSDKEKEFVCTVCGLMCKGRNKFTAHMEMVHERKYVCRYCNRAMRHEQGLREHEARHERRFLMMCDQCDYQCYSSGDLSYHKKSRHSGEHYQCDICKAVYGSSVALRYHKITHGEPLRCDQCDYTAFYNYKMKHHIEACHSPTVAECKLCKRVFPSVHRARIHLRKFHAELIQKPPEEGEIVGLRRPLPVQDNKYGTVEYDAYEATRLLGKSDKTGDGSLNSYINKRLQTEADRDMIERCRSLYLASKKGRKGPINIPASDTVVISEEAGPSSVDPDLDAVTMALVQEGFDFDEHGDNVVYIEAGTGRIVSESEVHSRQLQMISSEYAWEYVGERLEVAQMEVHAELVQM